MVFVSYGVSLDEFLDKEDRQDVTDQVEKANKRLETSDQLSLVKVAINFDLDKMFMWFILGDQFFDFQSESDVWSLLRS